MKKLTAQILVVIFCLLIVGQEFCSAKIVYELSKERRSKREIVEDLFGEDTTILQEYENTTAVGGRRKKRWIAGLTKAAFGAAFLATMGGVTFDLILEFGEGCCEIVESMCHDPKRFEKFSKRVEACRESVDDIFVEGEKLFEYAQQSNYRLVELWLNIKQIGDYNDEIVEAVDANLIANLEATTTYLKGEIEKQNQTVLTLDELGLSAEYNSVWNDDLTAVQQGLYLASYPLSILAAHLLKSYMTRYVRNIGTDLTRQYGNVFVNSLTSNKKAAARFGVHSAADIDLHMQQTAASITKARFSKTARWGPNVGAGVSIVSSLATIGVEAWSAVATINACKEEASKIAKAADNMEDAYYDCIKLNDTVKEYRENITNYWEAIRSNVTSEDVNLVLEEIKNMTELAAHADRMKTAADAITEWFDRIDNADEKQIYDMLEDLNNGLENVSYSLECYRNKVRAISYISRSCEAGTDQLSNIYDTAVTDHYLNQDECEDDEGYKYTEFEQIAEIIAEYAKISGYNADCILNSDIKKQAVCYQYWDLKDADDIATAEGLTIDQVEYFIATCGEKPLDELTRQSICSMKELNTTGQFTVDVIVLVLQLSEEVVLQGLETCDQETTTAVPTTTTAPPTTTTTPTTPTTTASSFWRRRSIRFGSRRRFFGKKK